MADIEEEFTTDVYREQARKDLLKLLEAVSGKKNLVLDRSLIGPIGLVVKVATLQEYGVEKFYVLENNNVDVTQQNVVFIARGECGTHAPAIAAQIQRLQRESQTGHNFHVIWLSRRTRVADAILEEAGLLGDVTISEWPLTFFRLEEDVLSLELDTAFRDLYLQSDETPAFLLARALMDVQQRTGLFPRITGQGRYAKRVCDIMLRQQKEWLVDQGHDNTLDDGSMGFRDEWNSLTTPSSEVENVIIIDRGTDPVTPLLTQLTYEGLLDEVFGIQQNQTKVDAAVVSGAISSTSSSSTPAPDGNGQTASRKRTIALDASDSLYRNLRDRNFTTVGGHLGQVARKLQKIQKEYETRQQTQSLAELREFVDSLPAFQAQQQSLRTHSGLAEEVMKYTKSEVFRGMLEVQQNLAAGADPTSQFDHVEELIARDVPLEQILRVICIYSCVGGGIKQKEFDQLRRLILQAYGYQHLLTLQRLEKMQLFLPRSSPFASMIPAITSVGFTSSLGSTNTGPGTTTTSNPSATSTSVGGTSAGRRTNYTYLRRQLRLIVDEVREDDPNDIAYVYSGYAPLSVRLIQCILQKAYLLRLTKGANVSMSAAMTTPFASHRGWYGFEDAVRHASGPAFHETQVGGEDKAAQARALLQVEEESDTSGRKKQKKKVIVVFVGGVTFAEISALRFAAQQEGNRDLIICTTNLINGKQMMEAAIEKGTFEPSS